MMVVDFGREIAAAAVVLGLLGASLLGLRRYQRPRVRAAGPLRVVAKLRVSEHLVLHLIECAGERCLVTEQKSGSAVVTLGRAPHPTEPLLRDYLELDSRRAASGVGAC